MFDHEKIWETTKAYVTTLYHEWEKDNVNQLAAAVAYYATLSLVPTLLILIAFATMVLGAETARQELFSNLALLGGEPAVELAKSALAGATPVSGRVATIVSGFVVLMSSTQLFAQLQEALNRVWEVKPPGVGLKVMVRRRLVALVIVALLAALVLASFLASAAISIADQLVGGFGYWEAVNTAATFVIGSVLMAFLFQILPAVELTLRDTRLAAALTVALLMASKWGFALYVGRASMASTYGAAGTLVAFLLWVYVSAQIVLIGAEFTQVHAQMQGREITLAPGAERRSI